MMSWSISSPATRNDRPTTIPPSEKTATSVVPPPMSTTIDPPTSPTGSAAPSAGAGDGGDTLLVHLADEVLQHGFGNVELGDHAVPQRAHGDHAGRGASHHLLGFRGD